MNIKLTFALAGLGLALASCSKEELPAITEADSVIEIAFRQPSPGIYSLPKFIDSGDDESAQFTGYTFEFQADGDFIATTNTGAVHTGFWDLNTAETVMELSITGTDALDDLDDDNWTINKITNKKIQISAPGPDKVLFQKIP